MIYKMIDGLLSSYFFYLLNYLKFYQKTCYCGIYHLYLHCQHKHERIMDEVEKTLKSLRDRVTEIDSEISDLESDKKLITENIETLTQNSQKIEDLKRIYKSLVNRYFKRDKFEYFKIINTTYHVGYLGASSIYVDYYCLTITNNGIDVIFHNMTKEIYLNVSGLNEDWYKSLHEISKDEFNEVLKNTYKNIAKIVND